MRNFLLIAVMMSYGYSATVLAHEGHDHDGPASVQAPKGGIIKSTEETHIEVVAKGKDIKVYFYTKDLKPLDLTKQKISLEAELPRTKKTESLVAKISGNMMEATFDAKSTHRYTLIVTMEKSRDPGGKTHGDKINFTIEPRK